MQQHSVQVACPRSDVFASVDDSSRSINDKPGNSNGEPSSGTLIQQEGVRQCHAFLELANSGYI